MKQPIRIIKALSDPVRLRIVAILLKRELCVCEMMFILKMEQSRISHHLRILRDADLVEDRREGKWILYSIPRRTQAGLEILFKQVLNVRATDSPEFGNDLKNLSLCLKEGIRKKHSS